MRYTTSTLLYQKNWISLNPTTPRGVTSSKAIVVTLVSSNTSKAQAHSRPHPHLHDDWSLPLRVSPSGLDGFTSDPEACLFGWFNSGGRISICLLLSVENIMLQWLLQLGVRGLTKSDGEFETKIIAKDDTITRVPGIFQGYETSEEESVERPRERDLYEFVNHPQLQQMSHMNEFAPHWLPPSSGNMNEWLVEDDDEVERNEVHLDLESTASSKPVWEKTTKDDRDCASYHCLWCSK
ncbi:hypothetical protein Tco_1407483 [Tanacetum coccineum]